MSSSFNASSLRNSSQRAFRQRKEGYIKKLEEQVRDFHTLEENYKAIQAENYQLRDYIINLQQRLIDTQQDYPQPPSNIDLPHPRHDPLQQITVPTAQMGPSAAQQLQASAAQAVADLGSGKHHQDDTAYLTGNGFGVKKAKDDSQSLEMADSSNRMEANGTNVSVQERR